MGFAPPEVTSGASLRGIIVCIDRGKTVRSFPCHRCFKRYGFVVEKVVDKTPRPAGSRLEENQSPAGGKDTLEFSQGCAGIA